MVDSASESTKQDPSHLPVKEKLMVSGLICAQSSATPVEIKRGMRIRSSEGLESGKVAAVLLTGDTSGATHILLSRLPEMMGYWIVSVELIVGVRDGYVQLCIPSWIVETLPRWHPT